VDDRLPGVLTEIRSILDVPADERPGRAVVEDTLTNGYACALALEGERLRLERRLRTLIRAEGRFEEIARLTAELAEADQELAGLRALLASLRAQEL
jgi:hypothetical protein